MFGSEKDEGWGVGGGGAGAGVGMGEGGERGDTPEYEDPCGLILQGFRLHDNCTCVMQSMSCLKSLCSDIYTFVSSSCILSYTDIKMSI